MEDDEYCECYIPPLTHYMMAHQIIMHITQQGLTWTDSEEPFHLFARQFQDSLFRCLNKLAFFSSFTSSPVQCLVSQVLSKAAFLSLFAVQHTVIARHLTSERNTYVLRGR